MVLCEAHLCIVVVFVTRIFVEVFHLLPEDWGRFVTRLGVLFLFVFGY